MTTTSHNAQRQFVYLVQGQASLIRGYLHLKERNAADAIYLTYDEPIEQAIFFPNSTWAQGRNRLLEVAKKKDLYKYFIFCDDDVEFESGGWDQLEAELSNRKPAIAIPVFSLTRHTPILGLAYQCPLYDDAQLMCFHHKVVEDSLVVPYQTRFDHIHWWASCGIQRIIVQNFYSDVTIQLNRIRILNTHRLRYSDSQTKQAAYREEIEKWLLQEFVGRYEKASYFVGKYLPLVLWRTLKFAFRRFRTSSYSLDPAVVSAKLRRDSVLRRQYDGGADS